MADVGEETGGGRPAVWVLAEAALDAGSDVVEPHFGLATRTHVCRRVVHRRVVEYRASRVLPQRWRVEQLPGVHVAVVELFVVEHLAYRGGLVFRPARCRCVQELARGARLKSRMCRDKRRVDLEKSRGHAAGEGKKKRRSVRRRGLSQGQLRESSAAWRLIVGSSWAYRVYAARVSYQGVLVSRRRKDCANSVNFGDSDSPTRLALSSRSTAVHITSKGDVRLPARVEACFRVRGESKRENTISTAKRDQAFRSCR